MMKKLILALFFAICTQLVWSIDNQDQLLVPSNIELALNDLTDTAHYELVKEYAQSLPTSDYDQFIALLETRRISAFFTGSGFIIAGTLLAILSFYATRSFHNHTQTYPAVPTFTVHTQLNTAARAAAWERSDDAWNAVYNALHRKVGFMAFLVAGILAYIDLRYAVTQQFYIISKLLNELKELHPIEL